MEAEVAKVKEEHQAAVEAQDASSILSAQFSPLNIERDWLFAWIILDLGFKRHQDESEDRESELQGVTCPAFPWTSLEAYCNISAMPLASYCRSSHRGQDIGG